MADPMSASEFLAALHAEGVTVREPHSGWPTHERDEATGKPFGPVHGVIIHHTAAHGDYEVVYTGNSSLPGPRAHGYINKAGEVLMCSAGRANHAGGGDRDVLNAVTAESYITRPPATQYGEGDAGAVDGNDAFYGFECENLGDGKDPWPRVQYVAMVKSAAAICRHYGWGEKSVIGHLEWSHYKIDPRGFTMPDFRADVKACLSMKPGQWPGTASTPQEDTVSLTSTQASQLAALYNERRIAPWQYKNTAIDGRDMHQVLRDTEAGVKDVAARVDGLGDVALTDAQLAALAARVVAAPGLADAIAESVAEKLAARLAE